MESLWEFVNVNPESTKPILVLSPGVKSRAELLRPWAMEHRRNLRTLKVHLRRNLRTLNTGMG
jgi:hypothetical protein